MDPASSATCGWQGQENWLTLPVKYASQARRTVRMTAWLTSQDYCPSHLPWYLLGGADATGYEGPFGRLCTAPREVGGEPRYLATFGAPFSA